MIFEWIGAILRKIGAPRPSRKITAESVDGTISRPVADEIVDISEMLDEAGVPQTLKDENGRTMPLLPSMRLRMFLEMYD